METTAVTKILDLEKLNFQMASLTSSYQQATPFPHIALEDFLEEEIALKAMKAFPKLHDRGWIHYLHVNEKKHGLNKVELCPAIIRKVIEELSSPDFCDFLSELTGLPKLLPDDMLEGGGLHQTKKGGFLNVHTDFTVHPHKRHWRRRVNLLIYLNENWLPEYGGELEFWKSDMSRCEKKFLPLFNRAVIFNTDENSFHGSPEPLNCPETMTRKSIALYYFREEKSQLPRLKATNYRARPGDGLKSVLIWLDKEMVAAYTLLKAWIGINDEWVSKVLNFLSRNRDK